MREYYWNVFHAVVHHYYYLECRLNFARRAEFIFDASCVAVSLVTATLWQIFPQVPSYIYAVILLFSQVILALKPLFPFSKQVTCLTYLNPRVSKLYIEAAHKFFEIDAQKDDADTLFRNAAYELERDYDLLDNEFSSGVYFPTSKRCTQYATAYTDAYFKHSFSIQQGGDTDAGREATVAKQSTNNAL